MKKNSFLLGLTLCMSGQLFAQPALDIAREVIVGNSGVFEFTAPYADFATVGAYYPDLQSYVSFDTIYVQSIQDVEVALSGANGTYDIFVAAEDSIVKYDASHQRTGVAFFDNIRSVTPFMAENIVVAGNWYGTGDAVTVFDYTTMLPMFSIVDSLIPYEVHGAAVVGDSLYVSYNLPGIVDACPPYGCFSDTMGMLAVIDLVNEEYVRSINLGINAAGLRAISSMAAGGEIRGAGNVSGNIVIYNANTGSISASNESVYQQLNFNPFSTNLAYLDASLVNDYAFGAGSQPSPFANNYPVAAAYEATMQRFFYTGTDYASYGRLYVQEGSGTITDSIDVAVSPENIAIVFDIFSNVSEIESIDFSIYPNPSNGNITVNSDEACEYEIYTVSGKRVFSGSMLKGNNALSVNLDAGFYVVKIFNDNGFGAKTIIVK